MQLLGHDGPPEAYWTENLITGEPLERCPVRQKQLADQRAVAEMERMSYELFPLYEDGHLLLAGGVADQPARYLAWMREISSVRKQVQTKWDELRPDEGDPTDD